MSMLQLLKRSEIDAGLWDACICNAHNGLIYARSYYLDAMAENWCGIVTSDYSAVMPLPFKKKYGVRYIYTPSFIQQLGIFSNGEIAHELLLAFIAVAKQHFKFADYHLNYKNFHPSFLSRNNFVLPLQDGYPEIKNRYAKHLKRNLAKADTHNLQYKNSNDFKKAILIFQNLYKQVSISKKDYAHLVTACLVLQQHQQIIVREVSGENNHTLAIALCFKDEKRLYFILPATTAAGRDMRANHFLIDNLVKEFAAQKLVLDFEGSDMEGIAHFYKNFGTTNQPYFFYHWNNLPWPMRILKS